jgi:hypothetical protein
VKRAEYDVLTASEQSSIKGLTGYFFEETATIPTAARVELRDETATGAILDVIILAGDEYARRDFTMPLRASKGVYVLVSSGQVRGCLYGEKS